jgi:hypothetical protein
MKGFSLPLSLPRRLATEFSYAARRVPRATLSAKLALGPLVAARRQAADRPPWSAIFARAFGLAAQEMPVLRQVYVQLPWPRLYQLPAAVGCIVIAREWQGEPALFFARLKNPAAQPLAEIADRIREAKTAPVESLRDNRRALAVARLPWPLRRLMFWLGLNLGRQVPNWYGSFGVSVLGAERVAISSVIAPWAGFLNYGPIGPDGMVEVYFSFDHRVMDGLAGAQALQALERMLLGPVLAELRGFPAAFAGAPVFSGTIQAPANSQSGEMRTALPASGAPATAISPGSGAAAGG